MVVSLISKGVVAAASLCNGCAAGFANSGGCNILRTSNLRRDVACVDEFSKLTSTFARVCRCSQSDTIVLRQLPVRTLGARRTSHVVAKGGGRRLWKLRLGSRYSMEHEGVCVGGLRGFVDTS